MELISRALEIRLLALDRDQKVGRCGRQRHQRGRNRQLHRPERFEAIGIGRARWERIVGREFRGVVGESRIPTGNQVRDRRDEVLIRRAFPVCDEPPTGLRQCEACCALEELGGVRKHSVNTRDDRVTMRDRIGEQRAEIREPGQDITRECRESGKRRRDPAAVDDGARITGHGRIALHQRVRGTKRSRPCEQRLHVPHQR